MSFIGIVILGFLGLFVIMVIIRLIFIVLKLMAVLVGSLAIGGAIGLVAAGLGLDPLLAVAVGLMAGCSSAIMLYKSIPDFLGENNSEVVEIPQQIVQPQIEEYSGIQEARSDSRVASAWQQLADMVPSSERKDIHRIRNRCAQLLAISDEGSLDFDLMELTVHIRRNLPKLAENNAQQWRLSNEAGQAKLGKDIMADLGLIEGRAERLLSKIHSDLDDELKVIRNHVAQQARD